MATYDELWQSGPKFIQSDNSFKLSTDSVLLGHFSAQIKGNTCADLGTGAGILPILLGYYKPTAKIDAIEIQPESAQLARENILANSLGERVEIITGDLRLHREHFTAGIYDLVVSNPPYFPEGSGKYAANQARATARGEECCTLQELCAAASYICRWGGCFCLIHRPERLSEVFCTMTAHGIEPKRLRLVQHRADSAPNLVLIEGRRGGNPGLTIEKPLILTNQDGSHTDEVLEIYHRQRQEE